MFKDWDARTAEPVYLLWGGQDWRWTRLYIAASLCDQQQADYLTAEGPVCHQCHAPKSDLLNTSWAHGVKTSAKRKKVILEAAAGKLTNSAPIVTWDEDGNPTPGPGAASYEQARKKAGASFNFFDVPIIQLYMVGCY
jgi:hypothetical protein